MNDRVNLKYLFSERFLNTSTFYAVEWPNSMNPKPRLGEYGHNGSWLEDHNDILNWLNLTNTKPRLGDLMPWALKTWQNLGLNEQDEALGLKDRFLCSYLEMEMSTITSWWLLSNWTPSQTDLNMKPSMTTLWCLLHSCSSTQTDLEMKAFANRFPNGFADSFTNEISEQIPEHISQWRSKEIFEQIFEQFSKRISEGVIELLSKQNLKKNQKTLPEKKSLKIVRSGNW